jgi:hypothetical protein
VPTASLEMKKWPRQERRFSSSPISSELASPSSKVISQSPDPNESTVPGARPIASRCSRKR